MLNTRKLIGTTVALSFFLLIAGVGPSAGQDELSVPHPPGKWRPFVTAQGKAGDRDVIGRLGIMVPLLQDEDDLLFGDLRCILDDDDNLEGNFGLGVRHLFPTGDPDGFAGLAGGLYAFYDRRRSATDNEYDQFTFGAEILAECFELRANLYCPEDDENLLGTRRQVDGFRISNTYIMRDRSTYAAYERALPGFDAEAGIGVPLATDVSLWGHAGYYDFSASGFPAIRGQRGRLTLEWLNAMKLAGAALNLGLEVQDADGKNPEALGFLTIRIPLGAEGGDSAARPAALDRAMERSIVRDVDVVTGNQDLYGTPGTRGGPVLVGMDSQRVRNPVTGRPLRIWFADADGSAKGRGSQREPMTLGQAQQAADRGDIIFLLGGAGQIPVAGLPELTLALKNRQQLCGVGDRGRTRVPVPGGSVGVSDPGGRPFLAGKSKAPLVTLANDNRVAGIGASGGGFGLRGDGTNGLTVDDVVIRDQLAAGIWLENASGRVVIANSRLLRPGTDGVLILVRNDFLDLTVRWNLIRDPGRCGILADNQQGGRIEFDVSGNHFACTGAKNLGTAALIGGHIGPFGDYLCGRMNGNLVTATGAGRWGAGLASGDARFTVVEMSGNRVDSCLSYGLTIGNQLINFPAVAHATFRNNVLAPGLWPSALTIMGFNSFSANPGDSRVYVRAEENLLLPGGRIQVFADASRVGIERLSELGARNHGVPVLFTSGNGGQIFDLPPGTVHAP